MWTNRFGVLELGTVCFSDCIQLNQLLSEKNLRVHHFDDMKTTSRFQA